MTRLMRRAATARRPRVVGLLAGLLFLAGCGSGQEGSVILKAPLDEKSIGVAPRSKGAPPIRPYRQNPAQSKKTFVPG